MKKLVKVSYTQIGQVDPFNKDRMIAQQCSGSSSQSIQTQNEMLQQILINQSSTFPAILQTMKAMNSVNANASSSTPANNNHPSKPRNYPPRDSVTLSVLHAGRWVTMQAFMTENKLHQAVVVRVDPPEAVAANMVQVIKDYYQLEEGEEFFRSRPC